jgi:hypothetical protein
MASQLDSRATFGKEETREAKSSVVSSDEGAWLPPIIVQTITIDEDKFVNQSLLPKL